MRVYHFLNEQYGLQSIEKKRLKISRMNDLNDPFEFYAVNLANKDLRKALYQGIEEVNQEKGLICFSQNWSSPLLWGHYADKHKGICLGFDIPDHHLIKINYVAKRTTRGVKKLLGSWPANLKEEDFDEWIHSKYSDWKYEEEVRVYVNLNDLDLDTGYYFADYGPDLILKEVVVGCKSRVARHDLEKILGPALSEVALFKVRPAFKSFKIVKNKDKGLW